MCGEADGRFFLPAVFRQASLARSTCQFSAIARAAAKQREFSDRSARALVTHSSAMASALDDAVKKVDDLILEVGKGMGDDAPRMRVDPDDPWADIWSPPQHVYKVRCEKTGYLMTKPFEMNNPMPGQFDQTCDYLVKMLKPVIKPKDGAKPAAPAGGEGGKKKEKPAKPAKVPQPGADEDPFVKARLAVGKVIEVGYVENSDKLYCCKVQVGPEEVRQVVTGLRKFVPEADLKDRKVLTILNLKVAKLAGQTSEAMILATEAEVDGELSVKVVGVPADAAVGDVVGAEGIAPGAAGYPKECKSKFWDAVKEKLKIVGGKATYDGKLLKCAAGECFADPSVPDGAPIK